MTSGGACTSSISTPHADLGCMNVTSCPARIQYIHMDRISSGITVAKKNDDLQTNLHPFVFLLKISSQGKDLNCEKINTYHTV